MGQNRDVLMGFAKARFYAQDRKDNTSGRKTAADTGGVFFVFFKIENLRHLCNLWGKLPALRLIYVKKA